jgi:hypothetical protein
MTSTNELPRAVEADGAVARADETRRTLLAKTALIASGLGLAALAHPSSAGAMHAASDPADASNLRSVITIPG